MIVALLLALAQATAAPVPAPAPAPAVSSAKFNLDTPIETIAADAKAKAVLDADLPTLASNPAYDSFKVFSLKQLQGYAPDKLTDELLAKVATDLAVIK